MFPASYFGNRPFAPRFFPKVGAVLSATRSLCYTDCTVSLSLGFSTVSSQPTLGATTSTALTLQGTPDTGCPGD